jgi:hypothetical protein
VLPVVALFFFSISVRSFYLLLDCFLQLSSGGSGEKLPKETYSWFRSCSLTMRRCISSTARACRTLSFSTRRAVFRYHLEQDTELRGDVNGLIAPKTAPLSTPKSRSVESPTGGAMTTFATLPNSSKQSPPVHGPVRLCVPTVALLFEQPPHLLLAPLLLGMLGWRRASCHAAA